MKKFLMAICTIALLALPMVFTSCTKEALKKDIVGTWGYYGGYQDRFPYKFQFNSDGSGKATHYDWDDSGKWKSFGSYSFHYGFGDTWTSSGVIYGTITFSWSGETCLFGSGNYDIEFHDDPELLIIDGKSFYKQ